MALPSSGTLSLDDIANEFGGSEPHALSEYYGADGGIPSSGTISIADFYGASAGGIDIVNNDSPPWAKPPSIDPSKDIYVSNNKTHNSDTSIYFNNNFDFSVTFDVDAEVDSESGHDFGYIYNGSSIVAQLSGTQTFVGSVTVSPGSFMRLRYAKDGSVSVGDDEMTVTIG